MVPRAKEPRDWPVAGIFGGIYLATLLAYLPALRGGVIWDDDAHVTKAALRSWSGLGQIWTRLGATQQYYPVVHSAFWFEHLLWGDHPACYHLLNVLLHATSACLLVVILSRLWADETLARSATGTAPGAERVSVSSAALLAGFIFALHPVCVESVAWISEQKNTLSTVFYLLSALTYLKWDSGPRRGPLSAYFLATGFFLLALLTKSVTSTLPAALLVVLWWKRGRLRWRDAVPLLPWLAAGAGMGLLTAWLERNYLGAEGASFGLGPVARCLLAGRVVWFYLGKLFWPANLMFIYPHWRVEASVAWQWLFPLAAAALLGLLWAQRRRRPGALAGLLFFGGTLFPALGFFNVYPFMFSYVADHFQYLACLGVIAPVAWGWGSLPAGRARCAAAAAVVLLLGGLTWRQAGIYRNAQMLYRATLARNPDSWLMAYNLGVELDRSDRKDEAVAQYRRALELKPDLSDARNNLGIALAHAGKLDEAIDQYRRAIAADEAEVASAKGPARSSWYRASEANTYFNLGALLARDGRQAEADECYRTALRLNPGSGDASAALGRSLTASGRTAEAVLAFRRAVRSRPADASAHNDLGVALHADGKAAEAAEEFEAALRLQPALADAAMNLGNIRREQHRVADAVACFEQALRANPGLAEAEVYLGVALAEANRPAEALAHYQKGLRERPASAKVDYMLGLGLRDLNRFPESIESFGRALRKRPDYPEAENDLGIALAQAGRPAESIAHFEAALRLRPDFGEAENNLGLVLQSLGRTEEAKARLEHAARLLKGSP